MSIIHDALKKIQQQGSNSGNNSAPPKPVSGYLYANEKSPKIPEPIERLSSKKNKAKSIITFLGSVVLIIIAFVFLFKQLNISSVNFANIESSIRISICKLLNLQPPPPAPVPLAKIVVTPAAQSTETNNAALAQRAKPVTAASTPMINLPALINKEFPNSPQTLNVHGVMSSGSKNVALIDDEIYQEGDTVDGVKIIKISLDSITVDNNGQQETIRVKN